MPGVPATIHTTKEQSFLTMRVAEMSAVGSTQAVASMPAAILVAAVMAAAELGRCGRTRGRTGAFSGSIMEEPPLPNVPRLLWLPLADAP